MPYMGTFSINIPQMLAYIYIPYMDPMGYASIRAVILIAIVVIISSFHLLVSSLIVVL